MIKRNLLVIGLATLLSACGFQLRGTGSSAADFALTELALSARNAHGDTVEDLREVLQDSGVRIYPGAPYRLVLSNELESRRTASFTSAARTAEYELTTQLDYEIRGSKNLLLLSNRLEAQSYYSQDGNNLIGGDQEAAQVRGEMRRELLQQLLQRLQQVTPAQLDQLQQAAEAKAQAEAEALEAARQQQAAQPQQSPIQLPIPVQ
ncbi:MAG TPA: LPS assembly lipoprotein LptE [Pseudomonas sp.]|nr:LPS assembly lipoprotein LptE [Pseudomonas sp.]